MKISDLIVVNNPESVLMGFKILNKSDFIRWLKTNENVGELWGKILINILKRLNGCQINDSWIQPAYSTTFIYIPDIQKVILDYEDFKFNQ